MIQIKKEEILKDTPEYEDYSENLCILSIEELRDEGLPQCGGCCSKKGHSKEGTSKKDCGRNCSGCKCKK